jgi:type II restriction enzyme
MHKDNLVNQAVEACKQSRVCFCKFISANDSGETGGHQCGIYIPKNSIKLIFDREYQKGSNKDRKATIRWQGESGFETESRFIYYGTGTRNEYRITRFGKGFELLDENSTGNLLVLAKMAEDHYEGYMFERDSDIEDFLSAFAMSPTDTNSLINVTNKITGVDDRIRLFDEFIKASGKSFPSTKEIAGEARRIVEITGKTSNALLAVKDPDIVLQEWLDAEYTLFKTMENNHYASYLLKPFESVEVLIEVANEMLNRRKSRAGKSLEHHLCRIFDYNGLKYDREPRTEKKKKPDFIFPGIKYYFEDKYSKNLVFLASKTTCKDRWRQILNEADRIKTKHLFTLQQGISGNQLEEMEDENVVLVCPGQYINSFPKLYRDKILSLQKFVSTTKIKTNIRG